MSLIIEKSGVYIHTDWVHNFSEVEERLTNAQNTANGAVINGFTAASEGEMISNTAAKKGWFCKRTDGAAPKKLYMLTDADYTNIANWLFVAIWSLPATVDEVVEVANFAALPGTGTSGIIYVTVDTNATYRWSGSTYIELVASPGTTDAVAEGSTNKYFTVARVLATVLTGIGFSDATAVTATDTILQAFGKLQKQLSDLLTASATWQKYALTQTNGKAMPGVVDFNTANTGVYDIADISSVTNKPTEIVVSMAGVLQCYTTGSGMIAQYLITEGGVKYSRAFDGGSTWSVWL